ncbi:hypothetical protein RCL_jg25838.t1 [Rhizophagus clarus]|uniref:Uncharacterized protein n=1 Tax=Rhizophagus clarus TaxID=94130 RepID=A0A8H3LSN1_9GLOM|nr:hypothetical protein RCL_jg25838.t1 [Rhizophagus clarus]
MLVLFAYLHSCKIGEARHGDKIFGGHQFEKKIKNFFQIESYLNFTLFTFNKIRILVQYFVAKIGGVLIPTSDLMFLAFCIYNSGIFLGGMSCLFPEDSQDIADSADDSFGIDSSTTCSGRITSSVLVVESIHFPIL